MQTKKYPLTDWLVEGLRVTAFTKPNEITPKQTWWSDLFGEEPEERTEKIKDRLTIEEGPYKNGNLIFVVHPIRIDWRYAATNQDENPGEFSNIGELLPALEVFQDLMEQWLSLESLPPITRLAFGAVLLNPADDIIEGYNTLSQYLPFSIDTENTSDFLYQINRRRDSKAVPDLAINRLSKWSVVSLTRLQIAPGPVVQFPLHTACRLEFDINTVPDPELEIENNVLASLLDEFIRLGTEIVETGDKP